MRTLPSHSEKYLSTVEIDVNGTRIGTVDRVVTPAKGSPYMTHTCIIGGVRRVVCEPHGNAHVCLDSHAPLPKSLDTRGYN